MQRDEASVSTTVTREEREEEQARYYFAMARQDLLDAFASELRTVLGLSSDSDAGTSIMRTSPAEQRDARLSLLLPLLVLLSTLLFLLIFFLIFLIIFKRTRRRGIALRDEDGPIDLTREEELEADGGLAGVEERWLEQQDESVGAGYDRAKRTLPFIACWVSVFVGADSYDRCVSHI